jgi:ParB family transcriptional regulator, chromosome partitioning protein
MPLTPPASSLRAVPLDLIRPGPQQARRHFDAERLAELAESLRHSGVVQPVVLRSRGDGGYELLAGERRWRAAQVAGLDSIPALIRDDLPDDEAFVVGLIENLQRESLSPMETAQGLKRLCELHQLTHEAIGHRIGKSREYVSNFLRLLNLAPAVQRALDLGELSLGHAKILAGLQAADQLSRLSEIRRDGLTVRSPAPAPRRCKAASRPTGSDWSATSPTISAPPWWSTRTRRGGASCASAFTRWMRSTGCWRGSASVTLEHPVTRLIPNPEEYVVDKIGMAAPKARRDGPGSADDESVTSP